MVYGGGEHMTNKYINYCIYALLIIILVLQQIFIVFSMNQSHVIPIINQNDEKIGECEAVVRSHNVYYSSELFESLGGTAIYDNDNKVVVIDENKSPLLKLSIYPSSATDDYLMVLYDNGTLEVSKGFRKHDDITKYDYFIATETLEKDVTKIMGLIVSYATMINENDKTIWKEAEDTWVFVVEYDSEVYKYNYKEYSSEHMKELIELLLENSPVTVDLHGWA